MMKWIKLLIFSILNTYISENSIAQIRNIPDCGTISPFVKQQNFDRTKSAFSTSERKIRGLAFIELGSIPLKYYQHPSWTKGGYLAPLVINMQGTVYTAPTPQINVLYNPKEAQNIIYRVDPITGEMAVWCKLSVSPQGKKSENPFGVLGLGFDCETNFLYATSVFASDRDNEHGRIYAIKISNTKQTVVDSLNNIDAMGVGVVYFNGEKRLFFGKTRTSDIFSIAISSEGKFIGQPRYETSLSELGIRGDDHARKIRFTAEGNMLVWGVSFYYNLTAPSERQEAKYTFQYDNFSKKWQIIAYE